MTEGQYRALAEEIELAISSAVPCEVGVQVCKHAIAADAVMPIVARELAARDAVIEQIRALAEEWRANSRRCNRCANDLQRLLSSLPSTGETNNAR